MGRDREIRDNASRIVKKLYADIQAYWGDVAVFVYDCHVVSNEDIILEDKTLSKVWVQFDVLTGDYKTGSHLIKIDIQNSTGIEVEDYIKHIFSRFKKEGYLKGSFYYVNKQSNIKKATVYGKECMMTFSALAFEFYMGIGAGTKETLKGKPVINSVFHIQYVGYIVDQIGAEGREIESVRIDEHRKTVLSVREYGRGFDFGFTHVYVKIKGEEKEKRIILPYVYNLKEDVDKQIIHFIQEDMKKKVNAVT